MTAQTLLLALAGLLLPGSNLFLMGRYKAFFSLWAALIASNYVSWAALCLTGASRTVNALFGLAYLGLVGYAAVQGPAAGETLDPRRRWKGHALAACASLALLYAVQWIPIRMQFRLTTVSMQPALEPGDVILSNPFHYGLLGRGIQSGDVVVHRNPGSGRTLFVHRILGVPGDSILIERGKVLLNGVEPAWEHADYAPGQLENRKAELAGMLPQCGSRLPEEYCVTMREEWKLLAGPVGWKLGPDQYFLLGDNIPNAADSRHFGPVGRDFIVSKAMGYGISWANLFRDALRYGSPIP